MAAFVSALWQDREIHFDLNEADLQLRPGEERVGVLQEVEDKKGNNGIRGKLTVTNLRVMWQAHDAPLVNISIGFGCIISIAIDSNETKLRGHRETLRLLCKFKASRLEFFLSSLISGNILLFRAVSQVYRSFHNTKTYRDIKKMLGKREGAYSLHLESPEQLYDEVHAFVRVTCGTTSSKETDGLLYITNVRIVWHCATSHKTQCDYSIPYVHIKEVSVQETTMGDCIMVKIAHQGEESLMHLKVKRKDKTHSIAQMLINLHKVFSLTPIFGVQFEEVPDQPMPQEKPEDKAQIEHDDKEKTDECEEFDVEDTELNDDIYQDGIAAYYSSNGKVRNGNAVYCPELGLAIEQLQEGFTINTLWQVLPPTFKEKQQDD